MISIKELKDSWDEVVNFSTIPDMKTYSDWHVFDENKSVKWNREEVERHNREYKEEQERLNKEHQELKQNTRNKIIMYILENSFTIKKEEQALRLWNYIYFHPSYKPIDDLDNMIELIDDIYSMDKTKM